MSNCQHFIYQLFLSTDHDNVGGISFGRPVYTFGAGIPVDEYGFAWSGSVACS